MLYLRTHYDYTLMYDRFSFQDHRIVGMCKYWPLVPGGAQRQFLQKRGNGIQANWSCSRLKPPVQQHLSWLSTSMPRLNWQKPTFYQNKSGSSCAQTDNSAMLCCTTMDLPLCLNCYVQLSPTQWCFTKEKKTVECLGWHVHVCLSLIPGHMNPMSAQ